MKKPIVKEIQLDKHFSFMYSNFVVSSQLDLYLLLARAEDNIDVLEFDFLVYKYGYPNDEVSHPLMKYGLGFYGFFEILNSPWIEESRVNNSTHPRHTDSMLQDHRHFVAKFKDVTIEVIAQNYELKTLPINFFTDFIKEQIDNLDSD